jgi:anaerobic ribonucleoside-triphosphate reductase
LFLGEARPDVDVLTSLTQKIVQKTNTGFFAYSSAFSYCFYCNTHMRGLQEECFNCRNSETVEWYDRITGYIQAVGRKKNASGGWNAGKQNELADRRRYDV